MAVQKVTVIAVDPYHKVNVLVLPEIIRKFADLMHQFGDEDGVVATQFFPRLFARDPGVLLLAAVDQTGKVHGLCAAATQGSEIIMTQPRLDGPTDNDAGAEMIEKVEEWAAGLGAKQVMLISRRIDPKWSKKHGFEVLRYIQVKELE